MRVVFFFRFAVNFRLTEGVRPLVSVSEILMFLFLFLEYDLKNSSQRRVYNLGCGGVRPRHPLPVIMDHGDTSSIRASIDAAVAGQLPDEVRFALTLGVNRAAILIGDGVLLGPTRMTGGKPPWKGHDVYIGTAGIQLALHRYFRMLLCTADGNAAVAAASLNSAGTRVVVSAYRRLLSEHTLLCAPASPHVLGGGKEPATLLCGGYLGTAVALADAWKVLGSEALGVLCERRDGEADCALPSAEALVAAVIEGIHAAAMAAPHPGQRHDAALSDDSPEWCERVGASLFAARDDCEPLYGRAGLIASLLALQGSVATGTAAAAVPRMVACLSDEILLSGGRQGAALNDVIRSRSLGPQPPDAAWEWYGRYYVGAAHGTAGIAYYLLRGGGGDRAAARNVTMATILQQTAAVARDSTGLNFHTSLDDVYRGGGSRKADLVQLCHGAAGFAFAFLAAHECGCVPSAAAGADGGSGKDRAPTWFDFALKAGDVTWAHGRLRDSVGLCHGVAGNGYVFLALLRSAAANDGLTSEIATRLWRRTLHFALDTVLLAPTVHQQGDRPLSLYEGLAGALAFVSDVMFVAQTWPRRGPESLRACGMPGFEV